MMRQTSVVLFVIGFLVAGCGKDLPTGPQGRLVEPPQEPFLKYGDRNLKILFHSNRNGNEEIYVMNADGTGQTRLTNGHSSQW